MRALLVDPTFPSIMVVDFDGALESYYQLLGCNCRGRAGYPDERHAAWVDDEGLYSVRDGDTMTKAAWHEQPLAGRILVTGFDPATGDSTAATMEVTELVDMLTFALVVIGPGPDAPLH